MLVYEDVNAGPGGRVWDASIALCRHLATSLTPADLAGKSVSDPACATQRGSCMCSRHDDLAGVDTPALSLSCGQGELCILTGGELRWWKATQRGGDTATEGRERCHRHTQTHRHTDT